MKLLILNALAISTALTTANVSQACTYFVNDIAAKNDMAAHLLTDLRITLDQLRTSVTSDYSWHESISTPMCPEELTYTATFDLGYELSDLVGCGAKAKVTKVEPWVRGSDATYTIEYINMPSCE